MSLFINPYDKKTSIVITPNDPICRTTIEVPRSRHAYIMGTYGKSGALQTTINILIEKLYNELTRNGIGPTFDTDRYAIAVGGCSITLGGYSHNLQRSSIGLSPDGEQHTLACQTADRNDGRGTATMAQPVADAQQPANPGLAPAVKRNRGTKSKK